ncbi:MAG: cytochrome c oxidase assembly protein [Alphaproteobacteria bacterium]|nr:cytochrome c oxidase assembly protein [Alphaproteobacteria bacterium]MDD9919872.1 cytochrome c oxidase assembly protein [Alphaproteobacteria bacterium]
MSNFRLLLLLALVVPVMLGVSYAFVPLYRTFCQIFGIPVPTVAVGQEGEPKGDFEASDRYVTVRFMGNQANKSPVTLRPMDTKLRVQLGQPVLTAYKAVNNKPEEMTGVAVHTILAMGQPGGNDAAQYVELEQCFCFEEQIYPASGTVNLPLSFTITPNLPKEIHTITFGYTLFEEQG